MHRLSVLFLLVAALLTCGPSAQETPADPADVLLTRWQEAREGTERQRRSLLDQLGALDDPRAATALLEELARAEGAYAEAVVKAIGRQTRPDAMRPLGELLLAEPTPIGLRRAAGTALGAQGNRGVDLLLTVLSDPQRATPAVRDACLVGLAASGNDRALRSLAVLAVQGSTAQRLEVLRLLAGTKDVAAVTRARLQLAGETDQVLAATAVRQLCEEKNGRADDLAAALAERSGADPIPAVRAELVHGLVALGEPATWPLLLRMAASDAGAVRAAVRSVAELVAKDTALVRWLAADGLASPLPAERKAALLLLRQAPAEAIQPLLARVRARLKNPTRQDLELAVGLHDLLARDPSWQLEVMALARSQDPMLRTAGLDLLRELAAPEGLEIAQRSLDHKQWEVRAAALRFVVAVRHVSSIPLLIARFGKEEGRLERELSDALFQHTGRRLFDAASWQRWWQQNAAGFVLPALASVQSQGGGSGGGTVSYFDIPLVSRRTAFVIDVSGSMSAKIGTDRKRSRLDEAKAQLLRVVDALPESHWCNLIVYQSSVRGVWDRLRLAKTRDKDELRQAIAALAPAGGTNIHDALELAFRDPEVDTIYLLTDGEPSAGAITDVQDLADEVRRWNRVRQVVIHGIAVGLDSALLKRLAAESGGEYRFVR